MKYTIAGYTLEFHCCEDWIHERFRAFTEENQNSDPDILIEVSMEEAPAVEKSRQIPYSGTGMPLYDSGNQWIFTWREDGVIPYLSASSRDWRKTVLYVKDKSIALFQKQYPADWLPRLQVQFMQAVMQAFRYGVLSLGGLYMHGILIEYQGVGIGICAPSGAGKTTHVNLWKEAGYPVTVLNGDNFVLKRNGNAVYACGLPWCGSSGQFVNKKTDYFGSVFLERDAANSVSRLTAEDAYFHYLQRSFLPRFDVSAMERGLNVLENLFPLTRNYCLKCRPDRDAAKMMKNKLDQEFTNCKFFDRVKGNWKQ